MTAPVAPAAPASVAAPVPAPVVASPEITQEGRYGVDNAIEQIARESIAQTLAENPDPVEQPRNERGQFTKTEGEQTPAVVATETATPQVGEMAVTDGEPEPIALPEGMVAVKKVEGRELAAPFTIKDADGELEIPDLIIDFTANGKPRSEPLDRVVKLAQMGVYNEERQQQIAQTQRESDAVRAQAQQVLTAFESMRAEYERVLSDDTAYLQKRAEWEARNSPEARALAEREQLNTQRQQLEFQQAAQAGQQFLASALEPAVNQIADALPTLTNEEIGAKLLLVTDRFRVHTPFGSVIPPQHYQAVLDTLLRDVVPWAQQIHDHRSTEKRTALSAAEQKAAADKLTLSTAEKAAQTARVEAQRAKNLMTRAARPGTRAAATDARTSEPPKPKVNPTAEEAEADAVANAIRETLGSAA